MNTTSIQKWLLMPFGVLYGTIAALRNVLFDQNILRSYQSSLFTISVGNLNMGGTGKTPMVEYLIEHLKDEYEIAVLSRGYGRQNAKTSLIAQPQHTAQDLGDEPMQYFQKFQYLHLVVDGNRVRGAKRIENTYPQTDILLLDDAFQHRAIRPHFSILLTDYLNIYTKDAVVPAGQLREFSCGAQRAQLIVVSKCPATLSKADKDRITKLLKPKAHQQLLFSSIAYQPPIFVNQAPVQTIQNVLLLTGIAKATPLKNQLENKYKTLEHMAFRDHYDFNKKAILNLKAKFDALSGQHKCIITTEKDWQRLKDNPYFSLLASIPIAYVPISTAFSDEDKALILNTIKQALDKNLSTKTYNA